MNVEQTPSGLWVPPRALNFHDNRKTTRTVTLPSGERAKVTIDDSGTVMQILRSRRMGADESLDAVVRPATVRLVAAPRPPSARADAVARPWPVNVKIRKVM